MTKRLKRAFRPFGACNLPLMTFRPAKGKGITISVDEAGRIAGFQYTDE
ncbi:hypothetical protein ACFYU8_20875 [Brevibacillus sp. NPDC003359]